MTTALTAPTRTPVLPEPTPGACMHDAWVVASRGLDPHEAPARGS